MIFGNGPTDIIPHGLLLNVILFNQYIDIHQGGKVKTLLFDVENDPGETTDLSRTHPKILRSMFLALQEIKYKRPVEIHTMKYLKK